MRRIRSLARVTLVAVAVAGTPAMAAAPHVHGKAQLDIAVDGTRVLAALSVPAFDLLGFERAPRDAKEHARLEDTVDRLEDVAQLFAMPPAAHCTPAEQRVIPPAWADTGDDPGGHADFIAEYAWQCRDPDQLDRMEVAIVERLGIRITVAIRVVTREAQRALETRAPRSAVPLQ